MSKLSKIYLNVVLLALLAGIFFSARYSLSDIALRQARAEIDTWVENSTVTSFSDWDQTYALLQKAIRLRPNGADAYNSLGYLYEWRSFSIAGDRPDRNQRRDNRSNAMQAYRTAISLRPAWPIGWAHLARLKSTAGEWDDEFEHALSTAIFLGKNEPRVQKEVTAIATSFSWLYINSKPLLRESVISIVVQGLVSSEKRNPRIRILRGKSLLNTICPELNPESMANDVQRLCKSYPR